MQPIHIIFSLVDHFEPFWNGVSDDVASNRVVKWEKQLLPIHEQFRDSEGFMPTHTFFYPEEEYKYEYLEKLASMCRHKIADMEIHLHHDNDTAESLANKLVTFKKTLFNDHGLLRKDAAGNIIYGFIHGNWALDNSRKDGRMCGVNNELTVLRDTGCYADFTLPSAPCDTQTSKINSIYYAEDNPLLPKSHDTGVDVQVGRIPTGDLMLIQGPLALNWQKRKWGVLPRIENGDLSSENPPTPDRIDLWVKQHIHVKGKPDWIFIKVHTHGTQEKNGDMLLNGGLAKMYSYLEKRYNDGKKYKLHYVSSWEMYNIIKAAEAERVGNPAQFRDYLI